MRPSRLLLTCSICIFLISCTVQVSLVRPGVSDKQPKVSEDETPLTLDLLLDRLSRVKQIKGTAGIDLRMSGKSLSGDASVRVTPGDFEVRIYSMGFLAGEFKLSGGVLQGDLQLTEDEKLAFVKCIKDGIFWWKPRNLRVAEAVGAIYLKRPGQIIVLDNDTLKPVEQAMALPRGESLHIAYKEAAKINGVWFPMKLEATSQRYSLTIAFDKKVELTMGPNEEPPEEPPIMEEPGLEDEPQVIDPEQTTGDDAEGGITYKVIDPSDINKPAIPEEPPPGADEEKRDADAGKDTDNEVTTVTDIHENIKEGQPPKEGLPYHSEESEEIDTGGIERGQVSNGEEEIDVLEGDIPQAK